MGILSSETVAVLPFAVDFFIDVSSLGASSYRGATAGYPLEKSGNLPSFCHAGVAAACGMEA
jgi:hypothetical protein